jgi:hypothetical protein
LPTMLARLMRLALVQAICEECALLRKSAELKGSR